MKQIKNSSRGEDDLKVDVQKNRDVDNILSKKFKPSQKGSHESQGSEFWPKWGRKSHHIQYWKTKIDVDISSTIVVRN